MNPQQPTSVAALAELPAAQGMDKEISTLIQTLHQTSQRLEELTSGEVDTVADREGRPFLLQHVQANLRHVDAARQAAILNALPANIALVDAQGIIVSVNDAWRRFAATSAIQGVGAAVGINYLEICDRAHGDGATQAHQVAAGVRTVLNGDVKSFSIEYPCHLPFEQRCFLLMATPLSDGLPSGAVIMLLDVTERKRDEEALQRFAGAMDAIVDAVLLIDRSSMRFIHVNAAACRYLDATRESLLTQNPWTILSISREELESAYDALIADNSIPSSIEMPWRRTDATEAWIEVRRQALRLGDRWMIVTLVRDITDKKQSEIRIKQLNRIYAVLSGINTLVVRVRNRDELFEKACRIAVDDGGFHMSMIGIVDRKTKKIIAVASAGKDDELLAAIRSVLSSDDLATSKTMVAKAIAEKKILVLNDSQNDPRLILGKQYAKAGVRSLAILPLIVAEEAVGALALYASETEFFHNEEMKLLTELAGDIAFAIDHIAKRDRLDYLAYYDPLTGLANQTLFLERLQVKLLSIRNDGDKKAVFVIDIERFRSINDAFGRSVGDELLKQAGERLVQVGGGDATRFARIGADRFAIAASDMENVAEIGRYTEQRLDATFNGSFRVGDHDLRISVKAGIALFPDDGADADTLLRKAEAALKKAKATGNRYMFFTQAMTERVAERLSLENKLRQAVEKEEFALYYQPKVSLSTGKITGAEALIRWDDPLAGLVLPSQFIPILEETGLIHEVGRWCLRKVVEDYLRWGNEGLAAVRIAVNVSPLQLRNPGFIAEIWQIIGTNLSASSGLELEITESLIMTDIKQSIASLKAIRDMGVSVAIDDFGTGFSSLSYLSKLPVDALKIDRSFILDMTIAPEGLALVSTIINLAHSLKLKVIAEGVETDEQYRLLRLLSCDEMQGFLFSKPLPRELFEMRYLTSPSTV